MNQIIEDHSTRMNISAETVRYSLQRRKMSAVEMFKKGVRIDPSLVHNFSLAACRYKKESSSQQHYRRSVSRAKEIQRVKDRIQQAFVHFNTMRKNYHKLQNQWLVKISDCSSSMLKLTNHISLTFFMISCINFQRFFRVIQKHRDHLIVVKLNCSFSTYFYFFYDKRFNFWTFRCGRFTSEVQYN